MQAEGEVSIKNDFRIIRGRIGSDRDQEFWVLSDFLDLLLRVKYGRDASLLLSHLFVVFDWRREL